MYIHSGFKNHLQSKLSQFGFVLEDSEIMPQTEDKGRFYQQFKDSWCASIIFFGFTGHIQDKLGIPGPADVLLNTFKIVFMTKQIFYGFLTSFQNRKYNLRNFKYSSRPTLRLLAGRMSVKWKILVCFEHKEINKLCQSFTYI